MLGLDKEKSNPANMIISIMAVGPPPIRPSVQVTGSMQRGDDDLTIIYNKIVKQNNEIKRCYINGNNETSIKELRKGL
jgi:DNA-directed RNA polymerase II subunit RPB1